MSEHFPASTASGPFCVPTATISLLAPGTSVGGRYRVVEVIGTGGYGVVYLAFDRELNRNVALKVLRPERASPEGVARFRREVAVAREISSPRLVRVFDIGSSENAVYLTMEHVEGESLKERLRRGTMSIDEAIATSVAILEGLDALHGAGVIHRDVKPGNVLLGADGELKLGDFGLARSGLDESTLTHSGALLGTSEYVAPEQALGKELDPRSDLYSVGVVMYEMLTGQAPFPAESALGILLARLKAPPPDPRKIRPDIPTWLARLVLRLLERKPGDRYPDAASVLRDLRRRHARLRIRRPAVVLGAVLVVLMVLVGIAVRAAGEARKFSHLMVLPSGGVSAFARDGRVLWSLPKVNPYPPSFYTLARVKENRPPVIAAFLRDADDWDLARAHEMSLIDPQSGRISKKVRLPRVDQRFPEESKQYFVDHIVAVDLDRDGIDEIIGTMISRAGIASFTFLYEPRIERVRHIFQGGGHHRFATAADLDFDGTMEVVLAGINNRLGWYNAAAAVRLEPRVNEPGHVVAPVTPDISRGAIDEENLLWYALLPRGSLGTNESAMVDSSVRTIVFRLPGETHELSFDGFLRDGKPANDAGRGAVRTRAYFHLREALRLEGTGNQEVTLNAISESLEAAREAADTLLVEAIERQKARLLVAFGRAREGETAFEALMSRSANRPEIAFQAAEANHLTGRLDDAIRWYGRGLGEAPEHSVGSPKAKYLQGMIFALGEQRRWKEGLAAADSYFATYVEEQNDWPAIYREFIFWREGRRPRVDDYDRLETTPTETPRYWALEFRNLDGAPAQELLAKLEPSEWSAEVRPVAQSLRAEVLLRTGRNAEALDEARRAAFLCEREARRSVFARGHLDLVRERLAKIEAAVGHSNE
jgi:hypothetical protein